MHLHSTTMQRVYLRLQEIGQGKHHREASGVRAAIVGRKNDKPWDYTVFVSLAALAHLEGMPLSTAQRTIRRLAAVHSIQPFEIRRRDERDGAKNHAASAFRVPCYEDVLAARNDDPTIGKTHGNKMHWSNGRANSRRPLTPEQLVPWRIEENIPVRPKKDAAPKEESATPEAIGAAKPAAAPVASPPKKPGPVSRDLTQRLALKALVPPDQQKALDELCGFECDMSGEILFHAKRTAKITDREFPAEELFNLCYLFWEKVRKKNKNDQWVWTVDMPDTYLRGCASDQFTVLKVLDARDRRLKKERVVNRTRCDDCLQALRSTPNDAMVLQWRDNLMRDFPDLWAEAQAAPPTPAPAPAPDPRTLGRPKPKPPKQQKPFRTFSDVLKPEFLYTDGDPPTDE